MTIETKKNNCLYRVTVTQGGCSASAVSRYKTVALIKARKGCLKMFLGETK